MFCTAFVAISFFARQQPENHHVLLKADKLVRTAGTPPPLSACIDGFVFPDRGSISSHGYRALE